MVRSSRSGTRWVILYLTSVKVQVNYNEKLVDELQTGLFWEQYIDWESSLRLIIVFKEVSFVHENSIDVVLCVLDSDITLYSPWKSQAELCDELVISSLSCEVKEKRSY